MNDELEDDILEEELSDDVLEKTMKKAESEAARILNQSSELLKALRKATKEKEEGEEVKKED